MQDVQQGNEMWNMHSDSQLQIWYFLKKKSILKTLPPLGVTYNHSLQDFKLLSKYYPVPPSLGMLSILAQLNSKQVTWP